MSWRGWCIIYAKPTKKQAVVMLTLKRRGKLRINPSVRTHGEILFHILTILLNRRYNRVHQIRENEKMAKIKEKLKHELSPLLCTHLHRFSQQEPKKKKKASF